LLEERMLVFTQLVKFADSEPGVKAEDNRRFNGMMFQLQ